MATSFDVGLLEPLLKRTEETHSDAVVVMHQGEMVGTWRFGKPKQMIETMSVTKSVVNLAIGRLITKGLLSSIDEPVYTFYSEWKQGRKKNITIKHIMNHMSGLQNDPRTDMEIYPSPDFVQLALCAELAHEPGTQFAYNNKAVNLLAGIVEKISGQKLDVFMAKEIFTPLGIEEFHWKKDSVGNPHGMAGLALFPEDLAKFGQLVVNCGKWNGQQVIDTSWFDLIESQNLGEIALLWWLIREATVTVNGRHIANLRAANLSEDIVHKLGALEGRYKADEFIVAFQKSFGENWREARALLEPIKHQDIVFGDSLGYQANGDLGQYIYIFPQQQLVFIRMICEESFQTEQDSFSDFRDLVINIANSL
jgi:CubicO group peptidase (beta-lactamase class C family)